MYTDTSIFIRYLAKKANLIWTLKRLYFYIYEMIGLGLPIPKDCASFSYIKISLTKAKVKTKIIKTKVNKYQNKQAMA